MIKVFNFAARKAAADTEGAFLKLVDKDIKERPESVAPLSKSLLDRVDAIEACAEANLEADRIEC